MAKDRAIGGGLLAGAVIGVLLYGWLMFFSGYSTFVLEITAFVAIVAILAILGWIGYVMATTPPPVPLEPETGATPEKEEQASAPKPAAAKK